MKIGGEGTTQIANTSMLNQNYSAHYKSGSFHKSDGRSDLITNADGQQILNVASSNLPVSLNIAETQSAQLSKQAGKSYQKGLQQSESFAENLATTMRQGVELSDYLSNNKQYADSFNDNKSIEQAKALNQVSQTIKDFGTDNNLTNTQASQVLAAASIGGDRGLGYLTSKLTGVKGELSGNISGHSQLQDVYRKAEKVVQNKDFQDSLRQAAQLTHNQAFTQHNDEGKRLADSISSSWDQANSSRNEATKSFHEAESYQQQALAIKNSAVHLNANYNQQFIDWLSQQPADNTGGGHIGKQGAAYMIANDPEMAMKYAGQFIEEKKLLPTQHEDLIKLSPANLRSSYNQENKHAFVQVNKDHAENRMSELKQQASSSGLQGADDHGLQDSFYNKEAQTKQQLNTGQQNLSKEYDNQASQYQEKSKKNLTGQAVKKLGQGVVDLAVDPVIFVTEIPSKVKNIFSGEPQTK